MVRRGILFCGYITIVVTWPDTIHLTNKLGFSKFTLYYVFGVLNEATTNPYFSVRTSLGKLLLYLQYSFHLFRELVNVIVQCVTVTNYDHREKAQYANAKQQLRIF